MGIRSVDFVVLFKGEGGVFLSASLVRGFYCQRDG